MHLKIVSCRNDDKSIFSVIFCEILAEFYFLNLLLPRKPQYFAENSRFLVCLLKFIYFFVKSAS